ncbi:gamma-glutamyltranspeptidase [Ophiostoma piceae UAMH 11346]|uniref:Gamma-glutamyltranspeptidase n=1 Tax=Ophiostoma piceae (strain UAMH 11346) TaxID=1262450 RepID=S3C3D7_OPHP1|nr:gamma-glutamyltranspeptidase [Ophiostoma piceae UAMH 11346]
MRMTTNTPGDPFFPFQSRRSVVYGTRGMVACSNPLAAQAGIAVLNAGGNAADAAVAVSAVLAVVDPPMTGIGGDSFALYFDATSGKVRGLNASGRTPAAATRDTVLLSLGLKGDGDEVPVQLPHTSPHAITVPAGAASWVDTVEQFGSRALSLGQVLAPAITLADNGFPVSKLSAHYWRVAEKDLRKTPYEGDVPPANDSLLKAGKGSELRAPEEGELMKNTDLATTLRKLAKEGKKGFYEGDIADRIVAACRAKGCLMTLGDLKRHAELPPDISEALCMPVSITAGTGSATTADSRQSERLRLWEHPPNGQGIVALLAMGILGELERTGRTAPLHSLQHNSAEYLHVVASALRIAFADAGWFVSDPANESRDSGQDGNRQSSPGSLLDPAYLATRAALFDPARAFNPARGQPSVHAPLAPVPPTLLDVDCLAPSADAHMSTSDTVYLAVADSQGNGCSFVNSMSDLFGSCVVVQGAGFALPNRGHMFRLGPAEHPNVYAGGKRAYNTIIPAIITKDSSPIPELDTVFGVMGGFMQPQGHVQVLLNMHAFGMDPQTALDAPRVCVAPNYFWSPDRQAAGGTADAKGPEPENQLFVEEGVPPSVIDRLQDYGYAITEVKSFARSLFGRGQVVRSKTDPVTKDRVYAAGSDGRGDGHAVPLY